MSKTETKYNTDADLFNRCVAFGQDQNKYPIYIGPWQ